MTDKPNVPDILIIDDSESDALLMQEAVKDTIVANSIHTVTSAADAIQFLEQKGAYAAAPRPDLILLDLNMPDMSGHTLLENIKQDPRFSFIPVIVLTTSSDEKDIAQCYRSHANCYVVKPVNFMKFKKVIAVINEFWLGIGKLPPKSMS